MNYCNYTRSCRIPTLESQLPMSLIDGPGTPMYNCPATLSVTLTLNWYCCPPSSPDTTPEETLAGKVVEKLLTQIE